jgi:hypothetical protein
MKMERVIPRNMISETHWTIEGTSSVEQRVAGYNSKFNYHRSEKSDS